MTQMPPVVLTHSSSETKQAVRQVGKPAGYSKMEDLPMS